MIERKQVTDWISDFDIFDPRYTTDFYGILIELRGAGCEAAHTERFDGVTLPITWDAVREIAYDTDRFSSSRLLVREKRGSDVNGGTIPPLTSDPPEHRSHRLPFVGPLSAPACDKLRPGVAANCNALIDAFIDKGHFDGADDYAKHIPTRTIAALLGLPEEDGDRVHKWLDRILVTGADDPIALRAVLDEVTAYMGSVVMSRMQHPKDDMISYLLTTEFEGQRLSFPFLANSIRSILFAGIDTTWSAIGAAIWHLATHPEDQTRLRNEPGLMPAAVEELLRAYAPVSAGRLIKEDAVVAGCPYKKEEMVMLSFPAANRDPKRFTDPDIVNFDRKEGQHAAFGLGIHRCVGMHLARMEMVVCLEILLKRLPDFRMAPGQDVVWERGMIRGPRLLPLVFG